MDLRAYRESSSEKLRTDDLLRLFPDSGDVALDIGARDGHFSRLLADRFKSVIALDLSQPEIDHPGVTCVAGNAASLQFPDHSMDFVFCAEVLEHIPTAILAKVCQEIERVSRGQILIGVPYKQDIRSGRTTCRSCGEKNPPWGHVNSFDERRIAELFAHSLIESISFVGLTTDRTNASSAKLMDLAGNPYGTYEQEEPCIHCGARLTTPIDRTLFQKVLTKLALWIKAFLNLFSKPRGNWIHVQLSSAQRHENFQ